MRSQRCVESESCHRKNCSFSMHAKAIIFLFFCLVLCLPVLRDGILGQLPSRKILLAIIARVQAVFPHRTADNEIIHQLMRWDGRSPPVNERWCVIVNDIPWAQVTADSLCLLVLLQHLSRHILLQNPSLVIDPPILRDNLHKVLL